MFKFKKVFTIVLACGALLPSVSYAVKNNPSSSYDTSVSGQENYFQIDQFRYFQKRLKEINLVFGCMNEKSKLEDKFQKAAAYKEESIRIIESGLNSENFMDLQTNIDRCEKTLSDLILSNGINTRYTQSFKGALCVEAVRNITARAL